MTLKWGGTVVTAVKWGGTNLTAVYWGSTKVWPEFSLASFSVGYAFMRKTNKDSGNSVYGVSAQGTATIDYYSKTVPSGYTLTAYPINGSGDYGGYGYATGNGLRTASQVSLSGRTKISINYTGSGTNNVSSGIIALYYGTELPTWVNGRGNVYQLVPNNYTLIGRKSGYWSSSQTETWDISINGLGTGYLFIRIGPSGISGFGYGKTIRLNSIDIV